MEIRRRSSSKRSKNIESNTYRSSKKRLNRSGTSAGAANVLSVILPIAAFAAVAYLILGMNLGNRLDGNNDNNAKGSISCIGIDQNEIEVSSNTEAENTVLDQIPVASQSAEETEATIGSISVSLPKETLYMLQMGVYSIRENCDEQSALLKSLGAAGYIYDDNGSYRVIAAAYNCEDSANEVSRRLVEQGYDNTVYRLSCSGTDLLITADKQRLEGISRAFDFINVLLDKADSAAIDFDSEERSIEYEKTLLSQLRDEAVSAYNELKESADENDLLKYVYTFLTNIENDIRVLITQDAERKEFSSLLKYFRIQTGIRYIELLKLINR